MTISATPRRRVALVTLGCTRNDVDSEELAGRLRSEGWELVDDAADAVGSLIADGLLATQDRYNRSAPRET